MGFYPEHWKEPPQAIPLFIITTEVSLSLLWLSIEDYILNTGYLCANQEVFHCLSQVALLPILSRAIKKFLADLHIENTYIPLLSMISGTSTNSAI